MLSQDIIRPLWRYYFQNIDGLIFVLDSADEERLVGPIVDRDSKAAKEELAHLLAEDELRGVPFLVLANKQDMVQALSVREITQRLELQKIQGREWYVQGCSARTGEGVFEGMDWFTRTIGAGRPNSY